MVPWPIRRVTDLSLNAKLREMEQTTHGLVQLIRAAMLDIPNQTPIQTNAQCVPYTTHARTAVAGPSKFHSSFQ